MENKDNIILITGAAGFIGAELSKKFLREGFKVIGIDNINNYYDVNLKIDRLKEIEVIAKINSFSWKFYEDSIEDLEKLKEFSLDDGKILEVNQIVCYFNYVNRSLNGLGVSLKGDKVGFYKD